MGYMKLRNVNIRENGKKKNLFDKVNEIKEGIKMLLPEIDGNRFITIMSHLRREYEGKLFFGRHGKGGKKIPLTDIERVVKEYLLKHNLNPSTVYRWFLATRVPSDVMDKIRAGRISQKKAYEIAINRRKNEKSADRLILMEQIRNIMRVY